MRVAVVAGTFDRVHVAHIIMLWYAFKLGDHVIIDLMSDEELKGKIFNEGIEPYNVRKATIEEILKTWVKNWNKNKTFEIVEIHGPYDVITEIENVDYLIVSEETLPKAIAINFIRRSRGFREVEIIVIPIIRAKDMRPLSSHRIRIGEIDGLGMSKEVSLSGITVKEGARSTKDNC